MGTSGPSVLGTNSPVQLGLVNKKRAGEEPRSFVSQRLRGLVHQEERLTQTSNTLQIFVRGLKVNVC